MIKKNKILILGGNSYIGSNLYSFLKNKNDVFVTKNINIKNIIFHKINKNKIMDIKKNDYSFFNKNFDIIINCIGNTKNFKKDNYDTKLSNNLLKKNIFLLNKLNYKLAIHISSSMVYGFSTKKFSEKSKCKPKTLYGKFKLKEENILTKSLNLQNKKIIFLRLFSIFGKENKKGSIFYLIKNKKKFKVNNPNHEFDLISMNYFGKIINKIILHQNKIKDKEVLNCCSGNSITPIKLINFINRDKSKIIYKKTKNNSKQIGNSAKLIRTLKIKKFNLKEEINKLYV
jgi:dTDP-4-dehydrorhamnose reductase